MEYNVFFILASNPFRILKDSLDFIKKSKFRNILCVSTDSSGKMIISQSARTDNSFPDMSKISRNEN